LLNCWRFQRLLDELTNLLLWINRRFGGDGWQDSSC